MILLNDFRAETYELKQAMLSAVKRVFDSGWYVLGSEVSAFEASWSSVCGVRHAVGVGNGMDAIEIALRSCGIKAGDEVITSSMTAFATVLAILRAGAIPILADVDAETALLSPDSVRRCCSPRTKAILVVHLYGQVRRMDEWRMLCASGGYWLIEDCAQSHLANWRGRMAGSFGVAGAYSFYPSKNLGAVGDAGILVTDDENLAQKANRLRNYGQTSRYEHTEIGLNSRLDELQAAILSERLKWLPQFTGLRRRIAGLYLANIRNPLIRMLLPPEDALAHVYHLFVVCCSHRDRLMIHLRERGIQALCHYPIPVHLQPPCREVGRDPNGLRFCERHAEECLSIPCHPQMSDDQVEQVIAAVNSFR